MAFIRKEDIDRLREIADKKNGYGIAQVRADFSSKSKLMSDERAVRGKQVLREKVYPKL